MLYPILNPANSCKTRKNRFILQKNCFNHVWIASCLILGSVPAFAQEPATQPPAESDLIPKSYDGEEDFEEASRLRLKVDSLDTLKEVIGLAESAVEKGLDSTDTEAAKKMIASSYVQKTELMIGMLNGAQQLSRARLEKLLKEFIGDLEQAIEYDPTLVDAYLIKTELHARKQETDAAFATANAGCELLLPGVKQAAPEFRGKVSRLLMMRAGLRKDTATQMDDLKLSIQANPGNAASIALLRNNAIENGKSAEAIDFMKTLIEQDPDNEQLVCSAAELMAISPDRIPESLALLTEKVKQFPESVQLLISRAKIYAINKETELSKADLDKSLKLSESNVDILLLRARVMIQDEKFDEARKDVDAAFELDNDRAETVLLRANIATEQKRYSDAIGDYQLILKATPKGQEKNPALLLQLGLLYAQDNRPTQAIKIFDQVIKTNEDYWEVYRLRGDTRLGLGDHVAAIKDFEKALELIPADNDDRSGILNNLAWVLCTSTNDDLRDGKRALGYAEEACKLTDYKKPHILSTLAAAHAEVGDFEKALEWSTKGVELARETNETQLEQLEGELKSYQEKKPWREKTETKENKAPIGQASSGVDS